MMSPILCVLSMLSLVSVIRCSYDSTFGQANRERKLQRNTLGVPIVPDLETLVLSHLDAIERRLKGQNDGLKQQNDGLKQQHDEMERNLRKQHDDMERRLEDRNRHDIKASLKKQHETTLDLLWNLLSGGNFCGNDNVWTLLDNRKCVTAITQGRTDWETAQRRCKEKSTSKVPSEMLAIDSVQHMKEITAFLRGRDDFYETQTFWMNYRKWDNASFINIPSTAWEEDMPSNVSGHNCIQFALNNDGLYKNVLCTTQAHVVCQRSPIVIVTPVSN